MKTAMLMICMLMSAAHAKDFFGTYEKYINVQTNQMVELASNDLTEAKLKNLSKSTMNEIAGVKAGKMILANTYLMSSQSTVTTRYCQVYHLFLNGKAHVDCKTTEADRIQGKALPNSLDFIINHVENVTAEVETMDDFKKGEEVKLTIKTDTIDQGSNVKILAVFANSYALVQKDSFFNSVDTSGILLKRKVELVNLSDLEKIQTNVSDDSLSITN